MVRAKSDSNLPTLGRDGEIVLFHEGEVGCLEGLRAAVQLVGRIATERTLTSGEAQGLLKVVGDFSLALDLLDQYDHGRLSLRGTMASAGRVLEETRSRRPAPCCSMVLGRMDERLGLDRAAPDKLTWAFGLPVLASDRTAPWPRP